ncbi:hypothetical protein THAOC_15636 [Thalassiosira oceanica]|uniref:Uncharacterized protein n=1 Tax=Thalassiosira oceanica TaxID=159749 RepID=K0SZW6_THAOC|nr:hypothetical protein THAOC_15636 [Thalassiosira oceanica]|eukprot:EJK63692.1 hypothetical protein THAOC_15636 [Thalassiosira oceanica]
MAPSEHTPHPATRRSRRLGGESLFPSLVSGVNGFFRTEEEMALAEANHLQQQQKKRNESHAQSHAVAAPQPHDTMPASKRAKSADNNGPRVSTSQESQDSSDEDAKKLSASAPPDPRKPAALASTTAPKPPPHTAPTPPPLPPTDNDRLETFRESLISCLLASNIDLIKILRLSQGPTLQNFLQECGTPSGNPSSNRKSPFITGTIHDNGQITVIDYINLQKPQRRSLPQCFQPLFINPLSSCVGSNSAIISQATHASDCFHRCQNADSTDSSAIYTQCNNKSFRGKTLAFKCPYPDCNHVFVIEQLTVELAHEKFPDFNCEDPAANQVKAFLNSDYWNENSDIWKTDKGGKTYMKERFRYVGSKISDHLHKSRNIHGHPDDSLALASLP